MLCIILMCIFHFVLFFVFLLMTYYLLFILYLFLTRGMMLGRKQIQVIFLFKFKMGHKAAKPTCNSHKAFGQWTANKSTVQWYFKKFCKRDESLEDEECIGWPSEGDSNQLIGSLNLILLQLHEKLLKNSLLTVLWSFSI